jgi:hypothetical protein
MKSKANKKSNKNKSRRIKGGTKHTSKHTLERSRYNYTMLKRQFQILDRLFVQNHMHSPTDVQSLSNIVDNIAPTYTDQFDDCTVLDTLLMHARDYMNDIRTLNQYHRLILNTIKRMKDAEATNLITHRTIGCAIHGFVPYHKHNQRKSETLKQLIRLMQDIKMDGIKIKDILDRAKNSNNDTVIQELFNKGYRIADKVKTNPMTERYETESDYDYGKRMELNSNYNELIESLPARETTLDTVYAFENATGKYMNPENVEELYQYLLPDNLLPPPPVDAANNLPPPPPPAGP